MSQARQAGVSVANCGMVWTERVSHLGPALSSPALWGAARTQQPHHIQIHGGVSREDGPELGSWWPSLPQYILSVRKQYLSI